jgi:hypothetical protein
MFFFEKEELPAQAESDRALAGSTQYLSAD